MNIRPTSESNIISPNQEIPTTVFVIPIHMSAILIQLIPPIRLGGDRAVGKATLYGLEGP